MVKKMEKMKTFKKRTDVGYEVINVFGHPISINKKLTKKWETIGTIKVLRIPERNLSVYIHSDKRLHIIVS